MDRRGKVKPVCGQCGRPHWNIVPCQKARAEAERSERELRLRTDMYRGFTAGGPTWGDSLHTLERHGNWFVQRRDDDGPQEAA